MPWWYDRWFDLWFVATFGPGAGFFAAGFQDSLNLVRVGRREWAVSTLSWAGGYTLPNAVILEAELFAPFVG